MRIAVLTELYAPSLGGQELFFAGISQTLQQRGHSVDVYTIGHESHLPVEEVIDGITVRRGPIEANYKKPRWAWAKRNWGAIFRYAMFVRKVARKEDYDLYILNQWPLLHALALPAKARKRSVLHWCEIRTGRFYRLVQKYLPRVVRFNAAISDTVGAEITRVSGQAVLTLPSGLNVADYTHEPRSARKGILSLGRVAAHKNLSMLIDSFELLKKQGYVGKLVIAGDGPGMPEVKARAAKSPVAAEIELLGVIDDQEKMTLLANSEVLAMSSMREGFPRVVAEAMSSGLPVVTADYPENGTKDIVNRYGAGVVTAQGALPFAGGITAALTDWDRFSAAGLRNAPALDWSGIATALEAYVRVI